MEYISKAYSSIKTWYGEINPATLTGAIDVIVVENEDGTFQCSPFHVRFGKMGVLRSREKMVDILVNGEPVEDLSMKLGENGEAFFVEETTDLEEDIPLHLATSPIISDHNLMKKGIEQLHKQQAKQRLEELQEIDHGLTVHVPSKSSPKRSRENLLNLMDCIKEPSSVEDIAKIQSLDEPLEITVETEVGKGKNKKQLKMTGSLKGSPKGSPKALRDIDTDSHSSIEDASIHSSSRDISRQNSLDDLIRNSDGRIKIRTRKRRRKSGKNQPASSRSADDSKMKSIRRMGADRFSSSSEDEAASDDGRIFDMEDVRDELPRVVPMVRSRSLQPIRLAYPGTEALKQEEWSSALEKTRLERVFQVFSDGDVTPLISPDGTRPPTPKSDTEVETTLTHESLKKDTNKIEWKWGELPESPTSTKKNSVSIEASNPATPQAEAKTSDEEKKKKGSWFPFMRTKETGDAEQGMYLADLASEEIDPEVYALYFPASRDNIHAIQDLRDEDKSSDLGASLPQSPNILDSGSEHYEQSEIQMSLCGGLKVEEHEVPMEKFKEHLITFDYFCEDPSVLSNQNLVVRVGSKFYNWQVAGPILVSLLAYQRTLPEETIQDLIKTHAPKGGRRSLTSWLWPSNYAKTESPRKDDQMEEQIKESDENESQERDPPESVDFFIGEDVVNLKGEEPVEIIHTERYKKTIRLSSEELTKLKLKSGANQIQFSVTTRYQGTAMCEATIYLWRYDSKIIISDIDGTITKSDVFGQILPVLGKDWTHSGVAKLFSTIQKNGFKFVFLSSRAIGQSKSTKEYLKSINQDDLPLPDGPLLLNPSSLLRAFHREVIIRKPEEFKIKCLRDIQSLFPSQNKEEGGPFFAGFGNRINDTWAYRAVGVPCYRIFTINPQGKVTHELTKTFQTSYPKLRDLVDHVFPPIQRKDSVSLIEAAEFSHFTYWRQPLPDIVIEDELKKDEPKK